MVEAWKHTYAIYVNPCVAVYEWVNFDVIVLTVTFIYDDNKSCIDDNRNGELCTVLLMYLF